MKLTRRGILFSSGVVALGAASVGVYSLLPGGVANHALEVISEAFGPEIAADPATLEFAEAYEQFVMEKGLSGDALNAVLRLHVEDAPGLENRLSRIDDSIIDKFATSTNVILSAETGVPLVFVTIFQPYVTPCASQLSAHAVA